MESSSSLTERIGEGDNTSDDQSIDETFGQNSGLKIKEIKNQNRRLLFTLLFFKVVNLQHPVLSSHSCTKNLKH